MEVSKEVKDKLWLQLEYVRVACIQLKQHVDDLTKDIESLTVTPEPAAPKHEWKVGDVFSFHFGTRMIMKIHDGCLYSTIDERGEQQTKPFGSVELLMTCNDYKNAIPISLDDWFAAVRKARGIA